MTLPTKLTVLRIGLTFVIMALLFAPGWALKVWALGLFLVAGGTDWLDGHLARRWRQMSPLGALLDPIADKVLILGMFLAFVQLRLVPAWMVLIIALREFLVTGVRLVAASYHVVLAAAKEGKHKLVSQVVTIFLILLVVVIRERWGARINAQDLQLMNLAITIGMWATMLLTLISGASFFWRHRAVLRDAVVR